MQLLERRTADLLEAAGLLDVELVASSPVDSVHFGDTDATFRAGSLFLRFVRDRGQEFLDVASVKAPDQFTQFDDIQVAFGWTSTDAVFARTEPLSLEVVVALLAEHFEELNQAFTRDGEATRLRLAMAAKEREQAFMSRLQRKR